MDLNRGIGPEPPPTVQICCYLQHFGVSGVPELNRYTRRVSRTQAIRPLFFEIAADNRNPYKAQYQSQLARAQQMNKQVMAELANSEKNDPKSGWWPFVIEQQNRQHDILNDLGENLGLGKQLSELKAQYAVLASKVATDNTLVERMVIINQAMNDRVQKA